jgi:hypothetical protein
MKHHFNINDEATVYLTPHGARVLTENYRDTGRTPGSEMQGLCLTMPFWEIMNIFGPCLYHGNPDGSPFFDNEIEI